MNRNKLFIGFCFLTVLFTFIVFSVVIDDVNSYSSIKNNITTEAYPLSHMSLNDSSVVLYMPFDVNKTSLNVTYDYSINNNDGTLFNGTSWNVSGYIGGAYVFDGVDDVIDAGSGTTLDNLSAITVTAWIYPRSFGGNVRGRIVDKADATTPTYGWIFYVDNGGAGSNGVNSTSFQIDYSGTNNLGRGGADNAISLNRWQHVAVTWNGSNAGSGVNLYVNGAEIGYARTTDPQGDRVDDSSENLKIGNDKSLARSFDGFIDEVMVFNRSLTSAEIQAIYLNQSYRYKNPATQIFNYTNISVSQSGAFNRVNITTNATILMNTNISLRLLGYNQSGNNIENTTPQNISNGNNNVTMFNISTSVYNISLEFTFIPFNGNQSGNFYSSILRDNIIVTGWGTTPIVAINDPQPQTYAKNTSLPFNNTATDSGGGLSLCWWNLDNGANSTLTCNSNVTFNTSEGTHTLNFYANDTSNNIGSASVTFQINLSAPAVVLNSPTNGSFLNYRNNIYLNYTPTDANGISICRLYGDFNGTFSLNQTNTNVTNATQNNFNISLSDNTYKWNVECNDTLNNMAFALNNLTFIVDTTYPIISIDSITTTVGSQTVSFSSSYTEINCNNSFYSVFNSTSGIDNGIENTSLSCSNMNSTFVVSAYSTYSLKVYVRDKAGYENSTTSLFTASQSSPGGSTGTTDTSGGGGSLGKRANKTSDYLLLIDNIADTIIKKGDKKILEVKLKNIGAKFLNNCRVKGGAGFEDWIESTDISGLAPGEIKDYVFNIKAPSDSVEKDYNIVILGVCDENQTSKEFLVTVVTDKFEFKINNIIDEGNYIRIIYSIIELSNKDQILNIDYWLERNNEKFLSGNKIINLTASSTLNDEIILDKADLISGLYEFKLKGASEYGQSLIVENIVISKNPLTGLVTLIGTPQGIIVISILSLVFAAIIIILLKSIWGRKMGIKKSERGGVVHLKKIPPLIPLKPRPSQHLPVKQIPLSNVKQSESNGYKRLKDYKLKQLKDYGL